MHVFILRGDQDGASKECRYSLLPYRHHYHSHYHVINIITVMTDSPCAGVTCYKGGHCVLDATSSVGYICDCPIAISGPHCEGKLPHVVLVSCQHVAMGNSCMIFTRGKVRGGKLSLQQRLCERHGRLINSG